MNERPRPRQSMERLDDLAKRAFAMGAAEAGRLRSTTLEPEHVLLGLLTCDAIPVGDQRVVELADARQIVEGIIGRGDAENPVTDVTPSPDTRMLIEFALREAEDLGAKMVGPAHLLLGLTREPRGAAAIAKVLGVAPEIVRQQVLAAPPGDRRLPKRLP